MFVFFTEQNADGSDTKNLVYATGDMIDWYVLKDADKYGWHADGYMSQGKVLVHEDNKPVGVETVYTYDGTSKVSDEATVVNSTIDAADNSLPGNYVVKSVVYKDANGNEVTDMINAGNYSAVAIVNYVYEGTGDEASYSSDDIEVLFPVVINKRPVTVTANNNSKYVGQTDPVLTGRIEGAIASDSVTAVFWRITGNESRGTYPIYVTVTKASANYDVKTYDGVFTIYENTTPGPNPPTPGPTPPAPGPQEEYPGVPLDESVVIGGSADGNGDAVIAYLAVVSAEDGGRFQSLFPCPLDDIPAEVAANAIIKTHCVDKGLDVPDLLGYVIFQFGRFCVQCQIVAFDDYVVYAAVEFHPALVKSLFRQVFELDSALLHLVMSQRAESVLQQNNPIDISVLLKTVQEFVFQHRAQDDSEYAFYHED